MSVSCFLIMQADPTLFGKGLALSSQGKAGPDFNSQVPHRQLRAVQTFVQPLLKCCIYRIIQKQPGRSAGGFQLSPSCVKELQNLHEQKAVAHPWGCYCVSCVQAQHQVLRGLPLLHAPLLLKCFHMANMKHTWWPWDLPRRPLMLPNKREDHFWMPWEQ